MNLSDELKAELERVMLMAVFAAGDFASAIAEARRAAVEAMKREHLGNKTHAAKALKITRMTLFNIEKHRYKL